MYGNDKSERPLNDLGLLDEIINRIYPENRKKSKFLFIIGNCQ